MDHQLQRQDEGEPSDHQKASQSQGTFSYWGKEEVMENIQHCFSSHFQGLGFTGELGKHNQVGGYVGLQC